MMLLREVPGPLRIPLARTVSIVSRTAGKGGCRPVTFFDIADGSFGGSTASLKPPEAFQLESRRNFIRFFTSKSKRPATPSSMPTQAPPKIPSLRIRRQTQPSSTDKEVSPVYVHPLSQLVLQYFQSHCHDWIRLRKLDHRLFLHRDGTFLIESNHNHYQSVLRIWTYYDTEDRKHWLAMSIHQVMHRFLLQDNTMKVWKGYQHDSVEERIQESVCDLMDSIDEMD